MTNEQTRDLIEKYFLYWDTAQNDKIPELFNEDGVWYRSANETFTGKKKIREFYVGGRGGIVKNVHGARNILVDGDRGVYQGTADWTKADGTKGHIEFMNMFIVKNGKFQSVYGYSQPEGI